MNSATNKLRVGVIGVGHMGRHHVRIVSQTSGVQLAGLHEPEAERAEEFCSNFGCASFPSLDELLKESDAVVIAAPTTTHEEIGMRCLEQGLHVMMEKPLAHTLEGARRLVKAADKAGKVLMVGHVERYNPAIGRLMELLQEESEEIVTISTRRLAPLDGMRCLNVDVLYDLLIHDVDLALEIANSPVERVSASGRSVFSSDMDEAHVRIDFKNKATAVFWVGRCSAMKTRSLTVTTPCRCLVADTLSCELTLYRAGQLPQVEQGLCSMGEVQKEGIPIPAEEPLRRELNDFFCAIREKRAPIVDGKRGLDALEAIEMVVHAMQTHR